MIENKFLTLGMSIGLLLVFVGISIFPSHHAIFVHTIMNEPPYPPSNPFPLNRTTNAVVTVNLSWMCDDPDGDPLMYDVYFGTTMPPPQVATNLSNSSYDPPGDLMEITTYFWQIVARDTYMNTQPGPLWWFSTGNLPPLTPVFINGPHHVGSNTSVEYTVFAQDPNGHDVFYFFDWGDGNNSGWLGPYAHNQLMKAMYTWKFDGIYTVRVKARDFQGLESNWSTPYSVDVSPQMYFEHIKSGYMYFQILRYLLIC